MTESIDSQSDDRAATRLGLIAAMLAVLLIKLVVLSWGVHAARTGTLSERDYLLNFHHHRLTSRSMDRSQIDFFENWGYSDAQWYLSIAESGYPARDGFNADVHTSPPKLISVQDTHFKYAFFPLWPMTIRTTMVALGDVHVAGFVAGNLASFVGFAALFMLLARRFGPRASFWSVVLLAASPFAMFFHIPYSESIFFLLSVLVFNAVERERWILAGVYIGLVCVTRPTGAAVAFVPAVYIAVMAMREPAWLRRQFPSILGLAVALIPVGAFLLFCQIKTGDPFYFNTVQQNWGYGGFTPFSNVWKSTVVTALNVGSLPWHGFHKSLVDFSVLLACVVAGIIGLRKLPLHYSAYSFIVLLIPLAGKNDLMSFTRYALLGWPLFVVPVLVLPPRYRLAILAPLCLVFLYGQAVCIGQIVNWHWVA